MLEYYTQRASDGGFIVSEGTSIFDRRWRMVRSPRLVFGGAGRGMEESHRGRSRQGWVYVFPTVAHKARGGCGFHEGRNPG
jgi:hypothetical protein